MPRRAITVTLAAGIFLLLLGTWWAVSRGGVSAHMRLHAQQSADSAAWVGPSPSAAAGKGLPVARAVSPTTRPNTRYRVPVSPAGLKAVAVARTTLRQTPETVVRPRQAAATTSRARLKVPARSGSGIPPVFHYTARSEGISGAWETMNPSFRVQFYDDTQLGLLVQKYRPSLHSKFSSLRPVERADVFRYVALWTLGGVYADADVQPKVPVAQWPVQFGFQQTLDQLDFILGIEFECR